MQSASSLKTKQATKHFQIASGLFRVVCSLARRRTMGSCHWSNNEHITGPVTDTSKSVSTSRAKKIAQKKKARQTHVSFSCLFTSLEAWCRFLQRRISLCLMRRRTVQKLNDDKHTPNRNRIQTFISRPAGFY